MVSHEYEEENEGPSRACGTKRRQILKGWEPKGNGAIDSFNKLFREDLSEDGLPALMRALQTAVGETPAETASAKRRACNHEQSAVVLQRWKVRNASSKAFFGNIYFQSHT